VNGHQERCRPTFIPIAMFLVLQRLFLRGAGLGGAIKG